MYSHRFIFISIYCAAHFGGVNDAVPSVPSYFPLKSHQNAHQMFLPRHMPYIYIHCTPWRSQALCTLLMCTRHTTTLIGYLELRFSRSTPFAQSCHRNSSREQSPTKRDRERWKATLPTKRKQYVWHMHTFVRCVCVMYAFYDYTQRIVSCNTHWKTQKAHLSFLL